MALRLTLWRSALPRAVLLAAIAALIPLPVAAGDAGKVAARPTIKGSMERIVARDVTAPQPQSTSRVTRRAEQGSQASGGSFFKSRPAMIAVAVMIAGTGYALYSATHDRIHSAGKK